MSRPWICVTGFGPFPGTPENPSEEVARLLASRDRSAFEVRESTLPVTIEGSAAALDAFLDEQAELPAAIVALGVQPNDWLRLERVARGTLTAKKPDNEGASPAGVVLEGGDDRATTLDVEELARAVRDAWDGDVRVSDDAGGYICERVYHRVLGRASDAGVPGLFVHIPPYPEGVAPPDHVEHVAAAVEVVLGEVVAG